MKDILLKIFTELNEQIRIENHERKDSGVPPIGRATVTVLGQVSLLAQPELTSQLHLAQTGDLDAQMKCEHFVKSALKKILPKYQMIYDDDSPLIFIPEGSHFSHLGKFDWIDLKVIDPESALVSKAVKAPGKNKNLIREALASDKFPQLAKRIVSSGGNLKHFT
jgi:hypothetical protein